MTKPITIAEYLSEEMSDNQLREIIMDKCKNLNGYYVVEICNNCGSFWTSPDGSTKTAKVVKICKNCVNT